MQLQLHELKQWTEEIITVGREEISALARCIRQFVLTVEKSVRFPSSPPRGDLFTATSAFRNTGSPGTNVNTTSNLIFLPYLHWSQSAGRVLSGISLSPGIFVHRVGIRPVRDEYSSEPV